MKKSVLFLASLISFSIFAESYVLLIDKSNYKDNIVVQKNQTEENETSNNLNGWVPFAKYGSNQALVTDEEWVNLVSNMQEGIKITQLGTDKYLFITKEQLLNPNACRSVADTTNYKLSDFTSQVGVRTTIIYHSESTGCTLSGSDYTTVSLWETNNYLWSNFHVPLDTNLARQEVNIELTYSIK